MNDKDKVEDRPICELCKEKQYVVFCGWKRNLLIWRCRKCKIKFETPMKGTE